MARIPERHQGPGPLPAIVGGVVGAIVLFWFVGVVISTVAFVVRVVVLIAIVWAAFRIWAFFSRD